MTLRALALVLLLATPALCQPVVSIDAGLLSGAEEAQGVVSFKGIPYAAPPVGDLRWRPPQPAPPWSGIRPATAFGKAALQPDGPVPFAEQDEDCLYLNVWTGQLPPTAGRPVMLWVHGGGFVTGAGSQDMYDGSSLARLGAVVVTINYRLGAMGFFAHPALSAESPQGVSGNYGLLDQLAALRWVQRNIAAFGGDPHNVTLFGHSAGGFSVSLLLTSPLATGLFHRAIIMSARAMEEWPPLRGASSRYRSAEQQGLAMAPVFLGGAPAGDVAAALRAVCPERVRDLQNAAANPFTPGKEQWAPCVDGWLLPEADGLAQEAGRVHDVPVLIGTTADEGSVFLSALGVENRAGYLALLQAWFPDDWRAVFDAYPVPFLRSPRPALKALLTDLVFVEGARRLARRIAARQPRTYVYQFTRVNPVVALAGLGAFHGSELFYAFDSFKRFSPYNGDDRAVGAAMTRYFFRFARSGDPNGDGDVAWPAFTRAGDQHLVLDVEPVAGAGLRAPFCDLWERLVPSFPPPAIPVF